MKGREISPFRTLLPTARSRTSDKGNARRSSSVLTNNWNDASRPKKAQARRMRAVSAATRDHDGFSLGTEVLKRFLIGSKEQWQPVAVTAGQRQFFPTFHDDRVFARKPRAKLLDL